MKFLVIGAGVLGSLYGARLSETGNEVTMLAHAGRAGALRADGIVLRDALRGGTTVTRVDVVEELGPDDRYDRIIVLVRKNQLPSVLSTLGDHGASQSIVFMVNNASGYTEMLRAVGSSRVLVGFAGAGGTMQDGIVDYTIAPRLLQRTTFGEPDGTITERLRQTAKAFKGAGFPVALEHNMDAWQKTHVAWVSPVANAIYAAAGDVSRLSRTPAAIALMLGAIRESFAVLNKLDVPITPWKLRPLSHLPESVGLRLLPPLLASRRADIIFARHANAARDEMQQSSRRARLPRQSSRDPDSASRRARSVRRPCKRSTAS